MLGGGKPIILLLRDDYDRWSFWGILGQQDETLSGIILAETVQILK